MSNYKGVRVVGSTVRFEYSTNDASGGRVDMSATPTQADVQVFKDGSLMTLDASTITITKVGSTTGAYLVSVDTSNDADFTAGAHYQVLLYPDETVDSQSVADWLGSFDLGYQVVNLDFTQALPGSPTADTVGDALKQATIETAPKKNTALSNIYFRLVSTSDNVSPATGETVTAEATKDGGAFAAAAGTATEISAGWYKFDATAADMNADFVGFKFTSAGSNGAGVAFKTVA